MPISVDQAPGRVLFHLLGLLAPAKQAKAKRVEVTVNTAGKKGEHHAEKRVRPTNLPYRLMKNTDAEASKKHRRGVF